MNRTNSITPIHKTFLKMKKQFFNIGLFISACCAMYSCVPARQYEEAKDSRRRCEEEVTAGKAEIQTLNAKIAEQTEKIHDLNKQIKELVADTAINTRQYNTLMKNYNKLNETYDLLIKKNDEMLATNRTETTRLVGYYDMTQEQLLKKQDELNASKRELDERKKKLG